MNCEQKQEMLRMYRDGLLNDTVPFWFPRSVDREHGGFLHCLGRCHRSSQTRKMNVILDVYNSIYRTANSIYRTANSINIDTV